MPRSHLPAAWKDTEAGQAEMVCSAGCNFKLGAEGASPLGRIGVRIALPNFCHNQTRTGNLTYSQVKVETVQFLVSFITGFLENTKIFVVLGFPAGWLLCYYSLRDFGCCN